MEEEWYSYGEIRYSLDQIFFLLKYKELLESGHWPPSYIESGYVGSSKSRSFRTEGYFVKAVICIGELTLRLAACGLDGELMIDRYTRGYDEMDLADRYKMDYYEVIDRISSALSYCRGAKRKRSRYQDYKAQHRKYQKRRGGWSIRFIVSLLNL